MNGTFNPRALNYGRAPSFMERARMAPQMQVPGGTMRPDIISPNAPGMREAIMQTQPTQSVAEILSQGSPGQPMPDLGGATSAASRQRQIADMLLQGAMAQDNTSIAGGLSQLGQAFLARRAGQKADTAEDKQREMASLLMQQAMQGGEQGQASMQQLLTQYPEAAMQYAMQVNAPKARKEPIVVNNQLVDPETYEIIGDFRTEARAEPIEVNGVLVDPVTYQPIADFRTPAQTGSMTEYQRAQLKANAAAAVPNAPAARPMREDQNGVLRYLDGNKEPVFPNVTATPEPPAPAKPLIGSEAMARVTAGLPNAKQAVEDLDRLVFRSKGTPLSAEGYDPASDWGAATIEAIPDFGLLKGVARTVGGEDYQLFKDSYGSFEAAMLPIISGAAITESEGLRQMRALEIKPGDSEQTKSRKIAGMKAMVSGVEMAARGDTAGFLSMLDQAGNISGAGPIKQSGTQSTTNFENASDDDLFLIMRGN